ncbi:hypothetical protein SESBI_34300 [Sesbania bispinosa]|nr:hypothetical protein SESBI_34300 [Sesbania bispinosa]
MRNSVASRTVLHPCISSMDMAKYSHPVNLVSPSHYRAEAVVYMLISHVHRDIEGERDRLGWSKRRCRGDGSDDKDKDIRR